jgi:hypothetical protein
VKILTIPLGELADYTLSRHGNTIEVFSKLVLILFVGHDSNTFIHCKLGPW